MHLSYTAMFPAKGDTVTVSATEAATSDVYFDPYDVDINADPYPTFGGSGTKRRCTTTTQHDFYALSRFADVNKALVDHETFSSARGAIIELIKANIEIPPGDGDFRGSADPRHPPQAAGPDVHPAQDQRAGTQDPRVLRAGLDPLIGTGPVRLRQRSRRADADEGDRHAAGHPRGRPGDDPRPRQCADAHRGRQADEAVRRRLRRPARCSRPTSTGAPSTRPTTS